MLLSTLISVIYMIVLFISPDLIIQSLVEVLENIRLDSEFYLEDNINMVIIGLRPGDMHSHFTMFVYSKQ